MLSENDQSPERYSESGIKAASPVESGGVARSQFFQDFVIGLYPASIIIGAGLLYLPSTTSHIGVIPLLLALVGFAWWMILMYRRLANGLFDVLKRSVEEQDGIQATEEKIQQEAAKRGKYQVTQALHDLKLGRAGQTALRVGMILYVVPADIGYLLAGSRSLNAIAVELLHANIPPIAIAILALGFFALAIKFEDLFPKPFLVRGTIKKLCMMASAWLVGTAILVWLMQIGIAPGDAFAAQLGLVLFTGAILAAMYTRSPVIAQKKQDPRVTILRDEHRVNMFFVVIEIVLLSVTALITLAVAAQHRLIQPIHWVTPETFSTASARHWANLIGVVIFAYVGTGIFNLCSYPALFYKANGKSTRLTRIVVIGTLIPLGLYTLWSLVSVSVLPPEALFELDQAKEFSTIGIARLFSDIDPLNAWVITVLGYSMALMAVTAACQGFTESLTDTLVNQMNHHEEIPQKRLNKMRNAILLVALLGAFIANGLHNLNLSDLLAVSGTAGGGLLLLILPWFLPANGRHKSTWASIMIVVITAVILTVLAVLGINFSSTQDLGGAIVAVLTILIALSIATISFWLIISEPEI